MDAFSPSVQLDARQEVVFRRLRGIARQRNGLLTDADLRHAGVADARRRRWVRTGVLIREARGIYRFGDDPMSATAAMHAALLSVDGRALTAFSGAARLDLAQFPLRPVHVIVAKERRPQPGVVLHRPRDPDAVRVVDGDGLPCASPARIAMDLAPLVTPDRLSGVLDRAVHLRQFDLMDFKRELARGATRPGAAAVRAALARLDETSGRNRVEHERRLIALINGSGLPKAANNVRIGPWEVDVHWFGTRAIVEADGKAFHFSPEQIARDVAKQRQLEEWGFKVMRVDWHQTTYQPEATVARAHAFYAANVLPPWPGPPTW